MNFNGIIGRDDWQVESWSARGTREECRAAFEGWHADSENRDQQWIKVYVI